MEQTLITNEPSCCLATDPVVKVAKLMKAEDVALIAVVESYENRTLVGTISDRDLALRIIGEGRDLATTCVGDVMSRGVLIMRCGEGLLGTQRSVTEMRLRRITLGDEKTGIGI